MRYDISLATQSEDAAYLSDFFINNTGISYISHGEIMDGRALDEQQWSPDLHAIMKDEFQRAIDDGQSSVGVGLRVALARDQQGNLIGLALLELAKGWRKPYAVLHDLVIAQEMRSKGVGSQLLQWLEKYLKGSLGIQLLFLESGIHNEQAHAFFHRQGFHTCSVSMLKNIP